jgi:GDP-4-dehydro-6-deoxy-D-mannose reductase
VRIFLTGISGFVGKRLAARLSALGHQVSGLVAAEEAGLNAPGCELWVGDLLDRAALERAIDGSSPDAVVHLAGRSGVGESWHAMALHFRVNVEGTDNLLRAAAGVERLLFASSGEVYGNVPEAEQPIVEERPLAPVNPYALTKASAELLALRAGAIVVRSFNLIGAGQAPTFALPTFARQLAAIAVGALEPVLQVGNLSARRDFLHVEDGVAGYCRLLELGNCGQIYNLASATSHTIREILDLLLGVSQVAADVRVDPERLRPIDVPVLCGASNRLRALGWQPEHTLAAAVEELWSAALAGYAADHR